MKQPVFFADADRDFQNLVNDCKKVIWTSCPDWSDHNVSDPGITMVETMAYLADLLMYRMNRVPQQIYRRFLEFIGERQRSAYAAQVPLVFELTTPNQEATVPSETTVSAADSDGRGPIEFCTTAELNIPSCKRIQCRSFTGAVPTGRADEGSRDVTGTLGQRGFLAFPASRDGPPSGGFLVGLDRGTPSCIIQLSVDVEPRSGPGVWPDDPPIVWEAYTETGWRPVRMWKDQTLGLNESGVVDLEVPDNHGVHGKDVRLGWLRARLEAGMKPPYVESPRIKQLSAVTTHGFVNAINARMVLREWLGVSDGTPGQRFSLQHTPVENGEYDLTVEHDGSSYRWKRVEAYDDSDDPHAYQIDTRARQVRFAPALYRSPSQSERERFTPHRRFAVAADIPPRGGVVRLTYWTGGGARGNVGEHKLIELHRGIAFVKGVTNREAAAGGRDEQSDEDLEHQGAIALRTRQRAVTARDYEELVRQSFPELARAHVLTIEAGKGDEHYEDGPTPGVIYVLVVPWAKPWDHGMIRLEDLALDEELGARITEFLDDCRCIGTQVVVGSPEYVGFKVEATVVSSGARSAAEVRRHAETKLYEYFSPLTGGPTGEGWEMGRGVAGGEVWAVLASVEGCARITEMIVTSVRLGPAPVTRRRTVATPSAEGVPLATRPPRGQRKLAPDQRVDVAADQLILGFDHAIIVEEPHGRR